MRVPRRLLPLAACAAIAAMPAVAHAQGGAGDDQYQDPFGGSDSGGSSGGGSGNGSSSGSQSGSDGSSSSGSATSTPAPAPAPAPDPATSSSSSATSAPAPATSSATSSAGVTRTELPRTGFEAPAVALLGVGLLAAGVGLRLRVAHGRRG